MTTAVEKHFPQVMFFMLKLVLVFTLIKCANEIPNFLLV